ncbi:MAG: response regulator [Armatimonadota bacterium]
MVADAVLPQARARRVLLVEDEKSIREALTHFLTRDGYEVCCAESGEQALELIPQGFDVLLTDLALGSVNGYQVADRFRQICPGGRAILLTGWGVDDVRNDELDLILIKPISGTMLLGAMRDMLAGEDALPLQIA